MLTTKKWRGFFGLPAASAGRYLTLPLLTVWVVVVGLVGCSPPGRHSLLVGVRLIHEGEPGQAIEPLKEAVALLATNAPACAQAWNYLGLAYHLADRPAEAAQAYQNALAKDFNLVVARFNRGCLLLEQANYAGAINELTTYTTHRPKDALGWAQLGTAQLRARLLEAADRSYQHVLELGPAPALAAETYNNLGLTYALRRRPNDAFKYFNAALRVQTNHPPALLNQAVVAQQQLNDRTLALRKYRAYLDASSPSTTQAAVATLAAQLEAELQTRAATNAPPGLSVTTNPPPRGSNTLTQSRPLTPPAPTPATAPTNPPPLAPASKLAMSQGAKMPVNTTTNLPQPEPAPTSVQTNPPPETRPTNRVETPSPRATTPIPSPAVTNQPAANPRPTNAPPPEPPPPPVEIVQLTPEPQVKVAQDLTPPARPPGRPADPAASSSPTATNAAATAKAPPPSPVTSNRAPAADASTGAGGTKKKSLVQKLNPLGWFGSKDKPATPPSEPVATASPARPKTTPAPDKVTPVATTPSRVPTPTPTPSAPAPTPPPSFARYAYLHPATPAAGDRTRADEAFRRGAQAQKEGRSAAALAAYKGAVAADPAFFDAQYNLGVAAFDASNWSEALAAFEHALAIEPANANARLNFALSLDRAGYPVDAAMELEALLQAAPESVEAHTMVAGLYAQKLGEKARAREHYLKVLELDPRHPQAAAIRRWLATNR